MNVKPIRFTGEQVRAAIDGRKTQHREVLKHDMPLVTSAVPNDGVAILRNHHTGHRQDVPLPYAVGDVLVPAVSIPSLGKRYCADLEGNIWSRAKGEWAVLTGSPTSRGYLSVTPAVDGRYRTRMIHLTLVVTDVRVERVQDISVNDVVAEGIDLEEGEGAQQFSYAERVVSVGGSLGVRYPEIYPFKRLWDSINAKRDDGAFAWDCNPWVAAYSFTVHEQNVDAFLKQREAT